jgi:hypothetical protein
VDFIMDAPLQACQLSFVTGLTSNEKSIYYEEDIGYVTIVEVAEGKQPHRASGTGVLLTESISEIMHLASHIAQDRRGR